MASSGDLNKDLLNAAKNGDMKAVEKCLENGADVHCRGWNEMTPLHYGAEGGFLDVAELLISKGADIDRQDDERQTALDLAEGKTKILLQLIKNGVDVSQALEAARHCDSLTEAQEYIQTTPPAAAILSSNIPPDVQQPDHNVQQPDHSIQQPDHSIQQPDQDIILPGIVDAKEFKSLLKLGTYESFGNRIYLAGACSVGKSTLACLLIGDDIPLEWKSTDGLKIFFGRNGIHLVERKMVPLDKDKGNQNILSNVLRGQPGMDKRQPEMDPIKPEGLTMAKSAHNVTYQQQAVSVSTGMQRKQSELPVPQSKSNVPEKQQVTETIKQQERKSMQKLRILEFPSIHENIKKELKKGEYRVKIAPSDLVDFGGQKSYDMTHQIFIQGKGTFTLLFDGRKRMQDPLPEYPQGNVTTESILKHWVDSILTYCGEDDDDILPVILFVATHRDTLEEDKQEKRKAEFKQRLKEMFQGHQRTNRIWCNELFFVNGRDKDDSEVNRLQATYVDIAFKQKSWGQRMPMKWVPLELQMSEMRSNNISIVSKDDLKMVNEKNDDFALTESQLDEFLRVQHSMGKILYFERQGLENYVIVQPTTLVDILRSFITDEMFWPKDETLQGIHKAMTETGKIKKEDLFKLWSQEEFNQHMPDEKEKRFVAQTLMHLDFLVEPKYDNTTGIVSDFYLVPCMVTRQLAVENNLGRDKAICLSYLLKSSVPSALSFKLIGAALNVWPLKETDKGVCLYHKAAILCIDKSNELHILVKEDCVIVYLQNAQYKHNISPDIASCAQECLTHTLRVALEFYHNSFGKMISKSNLEDLFEIRVGENCGSETCYIPLSEAQNTLSWTCQFGNEHNTKYPLFWTHDKKEKKCREGCTGLEKECLKFEPTNKHLVKLAKLIDITIFADFIIHLGLENTAWKKIEYKHQGGDVINMQMDAFCELDKCVKRPSFEDLYNALTKCAYDSHILCKVFREDTTVLDIDNPKLQNIPDEDSLKGLSKQIGNCAFSLGVELDVDIAEIENTICEFKKDMFGQNFDILRKWQNMSGGSKTIRTLMHALWIVDRRGFNFLKKTYKIV